MSFPSKEEFIKLDQESTEKLIDISILGGDEEDYDQNNFLRWEIVTVQKKLIELQLVFLSPLQVS